ncbi:MAG: PQQ-like beta-propeller repeat protein, partial [Bacteroidia bacterium]|nr:PQQ-like beta-propeller repeat protein [Bacteroidia bacterium]
MKKILFFFIFIASITSKAQTPTIKWWFDTNDASFGQPAAGDIDGDGMLEVVFGCYRNDSSVYALNAENGSLLWKYNTHPVGAEGCNDVAPVIYDVDNDTHLEVIVPSSCNPVTFCFDGQTGAVKWQCNTRGSDSPPTIADLDNDGTPEILHGEFGGYVKCINGENGSPAWEIPVDTNSWIQTAPTIVDLDNNGQLDFVVGTWNFNHLDSIYAFRGDNHTRMWAYPVHNYMYHGTAVADLDNDGKPELVIGSYNDTLYCINGENGTTKWKYAGSGGYIGAPASIGDIDNDGHCEVVF